MNVGRGICECDSVWRKLTSTVRITAYLQNEYRKEREKMRDFRGVEFAGEEYFENFERTLDRFFNNQINPYDLETEFRIPGANGCASRDVGVAGVYKPKAYSMPLGSILRSKDTTILTILGMTMPEVLSEVYNEEKDTVYDPAQYPESYRETIKHVNEMNKLGRLKMALDAITFETRHIGEIDCKLMELAFEKTKNLVEENDPEKIARFIGQGLKNMQKMYDTLLTEKASSGYSAYFYCNVFEKTLDFLDANLNLKEKVEITDADREYYEGMRQYAILIREGEQVLAKDVTGNLSEADRGIMQRYKDFQYLVAKDNSSKASGDIEIMFEIGNKITRDADDIIFSASTKLEEVGLSKKEKDSLKKEIEQGKHLRNNGQQMLLPLFYEKKRKENKYIRELGKCATERNDITDFLNKKSKELANLGNDKDLIEAKKVIDEDIERGHSKVALISDEARENYHQQKAEVNAELMALGTWVKTPYTVLQKYVNQLDSSRYDKKIHRNGLHKKFQDMKSAVKELTDYMKKSRRDDAKEMELWKKVQNKADAYLKVKDDASGKYHEYRPDESSYANLRYNLALEISNVAKKSMYAKLCMDNLVSDIYNEIIGKMSDEEKRKVDFDKVDQEKAKKIVELTLYNKAERVIRSNQSYEKFNVGTLASDIKKDVVEMFGFVNKAQGSKCNAEDNKAINNWFDTTLRGCEERIYKHFVKGAAGTVKQKNLFEHAPKQESNNLKQNKVKNKKNAIKK